MAGRWGRLTRLVGKEFSSLQSTHIRFYFSAMTLSKRIGVYVSVCIRAHVCIKVCVCVHVHVYVYVCVCVSYLATSLPSLSLRETLSLHAWCYECV